MMAQDETAPTSTSVAPGIRWWPATAAVALGAALQVAAALLLGENVAYVLFGSVFIIWPLTIFLLLLWWTFASRLSWRTRARGLLVVLAVFVLLIGVFRFDEFDGAMIPRFSFRWRPSPRARAQAYFSSRAKQTQKPAVPDTDDSPDELSVTAGPEDWTGFRGPNRDDVVLGESLRMDWDARPPRELWRQPIGLGWGSFAVVGRHAWTLEQRGAEEFVVCYDVESGRERWTHADASRFESVQGGVGPRSTPTFHAGRLFTQGATGILNCLDASTGQRIWSRNTLEDAGSTNLEWGQAGSPLIVDDLVITCPGANNARTSKAAAVIAYRQSDGQIAWSAGTHPGSYASPHLAELHGDRQLLVFHALGVTALSPDHGEKRWSFDWTNTTRINATQPLVIDDRRVLIGSGYGKGSVLLQIDPPAADSGSQQWRVSEIWQSRQFKVKFNGAVRRGDYLYGLDEGLLTCLDLKTGQRRWKKGRYGYGQMLLVKDTLLILTEEGDVVLVPATPETPRELARFSAIHGKTWNHPVLAHGRLLVRNSEEAACFDLR